MALTTIYFMDGFDHYVTADLNKKWNSGSGSILAAVGRQGTAAWRLFNNATQLKSIAGVSTVSVAFAVKNVDGGAGTLLRLQNSGTIHVDLRWNADHTLSPRLAGSTVLGTSTALSTGNYYHVELKVVVGDSPTGSVELRINGAVALNLTGIDTRNGATTTINEIVLGGNGLQFYIDDLHVGDDIIGDRHIRTKYADAAGNYSEQTPTGSGTNFENVDETPFNTVDYNTADAVDERDTYGFQDAVAGEGILAVAVNIVCQKTDAGSASAAPLLRHSSTDYLGTAFNPSDSSWLIFQQVYMQHPSAVDWTPTNMNATEFGDKRTV
jgi:hypothetical protein